LTWITKTQTYVYRLLHNNVHHINASNAITLSFTFAEFQSCTLTLTIQNWTVWWWGFKGSTHGVGTVWWELFSKQVDIWFSVSLFLFTYLQADLLFCVGPMADLDSLVCILALLWCVCIVLQVHSQTSGVDYRSKAQQKQIFYVMTNCYLDSCFMSVSLYICV